MLFLVGLVQRLADPNFRSQVTAQPNLRFESLPDTGHSVSNQPSGLADVAALASLTSSSRPARRRNANHRMFGRMKRLLLFAAVLNLSSAPFYGLPASTVNITGSLASLSTGITLYPLFNSTHSK